MFFFTREISEMRGPTGEKHAKFGPISDYFEVRRRMSPKRMKIFKIGFLIYLPRFLPR